MLAVITERFERLRNLSGTTIAAYYDAGLDFICSRMLSRIVQVTHYHASVGTARAGVVTLSLSAHVKLRVNRR